MFLYFLCEWEQSISDIILLHQGLKRFRSWNFHNNGINAGKRWRLENNPCLGVSELCLFGFPFILEIWYHYSYPVKLHFRLQYNEFGRFILSLECLEIVTRFWQSIFYTETYQCPCCNKKVSLLEPLTSIKFLWSKNQFLKKKWTPIADKIAK